MNTERVTNNSENSQFALKTFTTISQCGSAALVGVVPLASQKGRVFLMSLTKTILIGFFLFFMYLFLIEVDFIDERPSFYNTKYTDQICVLSLLQQFQKSYYQNQISNFDNAQRCVKFRKLNFSGRPNRSRSTHLLYI